jgi:hypothetical protein
VKTQSGERPEKRALPGGRAQELGWLKHREMPAVVPLQ